MLKTYKGRYEYGKLVFPANEQVLIPNTANIIITILEDDIITGTSDEKFNLTQQNIAQNFLNAMRELRKEGFTAEDEAAISELQSGKYKPTFEGRIDT